MDLYSSYVTLICLDTPSEGGGGLVGGGTSPVGSPSGGDHGDTGTVHSAPYSGKGGGRTW